MTFGLLIGPEQAFGPEVEDVASANTATRYRSWQALTQCWIVVGVVGHASALSAANQGRRGSLMQAVD